MDLNGGGVGCALSHIELWAHISLHGYLQALVIEDDSLIPSTFLTDFAERMKSVPKTFRLPQLQSNGGSPASQESLTFKNDGPDDDDCWDLIYVSGLDTARKGHLLLTDQPGFRYVHQAHRTTNCYLTHARGCDRLLESCVPLSYQLDTQMTLQCAPHPDSGELYVVEPRCFTMYPPLVVQATRFGSDIQTDNPGSNPAAEEKARMEEAGWNQSSPSP
jgi:GR25 family glycosyltransferase involved in LPS biosynthesis